MREDTFLRNQWYVAATAAEVGRAPLARRVCGQPMVMFRRQDGSVAVLEDRCAHRKVPLSKGEVVGDDIQCGYHGFRFDGSGACTLISTKDPIPRGFGVRAYAGVERHGLIFVWMGEAAADQSLIPDFGHNADPGWAVVWGYTYVKGHHQLLMDNVLDLTHVVYTHKTTLAGGGVTDNPLEVTVAGDRVHAERLMRNVDTAPIFKAAKGLAGKIDRWQILDFIPPIYMVANLGAMPPGQSKELGKEPTHIIYNSFTPETERSTHYFWQVVRDWSIDDQKVSDMFRDMIVFAFDEDARIVEAQQARIDDDPSGAPLASFSGDRAGQEARRIVARMLAEEARAAAPQRKRAG
jgi:vanillate O-demethylase monooxygenase subunit